MVMAFEDPDPISHPSTQWGVPTAISLMPLDSMAEDANFTDNIFMGNISRQRPIAWKEKDTPILVHIIIGIYLLFGLLIAVFNSLTIVAIIKCPELKTVTNMFVLSLSCADLLLSPTMFLINYLPHTLDILGVPLTRVLSTTLLSLMFTSSAASLFSILAIAVDRYFAVLHPYNYKQIMTHQRARVVIIFIWIYVTTFMTSLTAYYIWQTEPAIFVRLSLISVIIPFPVYVGAIVSQIAICIVASVILYAMIYTAIRKRQKVSLCLRGRNPYSESAESRRITHTMALVLGALIMSWAPYSIVSVVVTQDFMARHHWMAYLVIVFILLLYSNSFMNPIIYAARSRAFRRAYVHTIKCCCKGKDAHSIYTNVEAANSASIKSTKESMTTESSVPLFKDVEHNQTPVADAPDAAGSNLSSSKIPNGESNTTKM